MAWCKLGFQVPELQLVIASPAGEGLAIGSDRECRDRSEVCPLLKRLQVAVAGFPAPERAVGSAADDRTAIRGERQWTRTGPSPQNDAS